MGICVCHCIHTQEHLIKMSEQKIKDVPQALEEKVAR